MPHDQDNLSQDAGARGQAIARLLADIRSAVAAGRSFNEGAVMAAHPELMPELGEQLKRLRGAVTPDNDAPASSETVARPIPPMSQPVPAPHDSANQWAAAAADTSTTSFSGTGGTGARATAAAMQVPGYSIQRELSRGGQGVVYLAIQLNTGRKVALKVMREGPLADERQMARFQREVQILAALDHPNIVSIIDTGSTADGNQYITMPFIAGVSLDEHMQRRHQKDPADPSKLLRMFYKICLAVNEAHLRGIVHRDLKPSNIRVDERGEPHVLDFGLARSALDRSTDGTPQRVSVTGEFLGSLPWSSPEQAEGDPDKIDVRTDVYSLGVILYQMLTGGRFPYEVVGNIRDVLNNIVTTAPKPPRQVIAAMAAAQAQSDRQATPHTLPVVNEVMERIVLKALAKHKDMRYQNAGELGKDIARYLRGSIVQQPAAGSAPGAAPTDNIPAPPPPRRWLGITAIGAAAMLLLLVGLGVLWHYVGRKNGASNAPPDAAQVEPQADGRFPAADPTTPGPASSLDGGRWMSLFNGRDLTEWQLLAPARAGDLPRWTVQDGTMEGRGTDTLPNGRGGAEFIQTAQLFQDFHLRFNVMIAEGTAGAVQFVIPTNPGVQSPETVRSNHAISMKIFIVGDAAAAQRTGNIMVDGTPKANSKLRSAQRGTYMSMDIIREGVNVNVRVNDELVSSYTEPRLKGPGYIHFEVNGESTIRFKDVQIMQPGNDLDAVPLAGAGGPQRIDLLKLVDIRQDVVAGTWKQNNGRLSCVPGVQSRIEFPYTPPQEYDLRVAFTRDSGQDAVASLMYAAGRQFECVMGANANTVAAFARVAGAFPAQNRTTKRSPGWLNNAQQYTLVVKVRKARADAYLDGELITSIETDFSDLSLGPTWSLNHPNVLGFLAHNSSATVYSAELVEVTGHGKPTRPTITVNPSHEGDIWANTQGMKFAYIPAGQFTMGSLPNEWRNGGNEPRHQVTISKSFCLGSAPVTRGEFAKFVNDTKYVTDAEKAGSAVVSRGRSRGGRFVESGASWRNPGATQDDSYPVTEVSWNDATAFCQWLSKLENRNYHLPTEAQWEYGCRAGTLTASFVGDDASKLDAYAWFDPGANSQVHPVAQKLPNPWGLYDMLGNVEQWCSDWYGNYPLQPSTDPTGAASGTERVYRGARWVVGAGGQRSGLRNHAAADVASNMRGFRVALELDAP